MTFAPPTLRDLAAYWVARGGVNLGIVGDTRHVSRGVSYHLGRDDLRTDAYSRQTPRDRIGLSLAASAIDLGRLRGSLVELQDFSRWLVLSARAEGPGTRDMREIIYSPDGDAVLRWDRERGFSSAPRTGEADSTHRTHTHISYYRDSETHDKIIAFRGYWEQDDMAQLPISDTTPATVTIGRGTRRYMPDGQPDGYIFDQAYVRFSPYGVGSFRAYYATVDSKRVLRLVVPTASEPVPIPVADCESAIETAIAADRARARIVYG